MFYLVCYFFSFVCFFVWYCFNCAFSYCTPRERKWGDSLPRFMTSKLSKDGTKGKVLWPGFLRPTHLLKRSLLEADPRFSVKKFQRFLSSLFDTIDIQRLLHGSKQNGIQQVVNALGQWPWQSQSIRRGGAFEVG